MSSRWLPSHRADPLSDSDLPPLYRQIQFPTPVLLQSGTTAVHAIASDPRFARLAHDLVASRPSTARAADAAGRAALDAACEACRAEMERALLERLLGTVLHAVVFRKPSGSGDRSGSDTLRALSDWASKLTPADREGLASDPAGFTEGALAADFLWRLVSADPGKRPENMSAAMRHPFFVSSEVKPPPGQRRTSVGALAAGRAADDAAVGGQRRPSPVALPGRGDAPAAAPSPHAPSPPSQQRPNGPPAPQRRPHSSPGAIPGTRGAAEPSGVAGGAPQRARGGFWDDDEPSPSPSRYSLFGGLAPAPSQANRAAAASAAAAPIPLQPANARPTLFTSAASFRTYQAAVTTSDPPASRARPPLPPGPGDSGSPSSALHGPIRGLGLDPATFEGEIRPRVGAVLPTLDEAEQEGVEGRNSVGSRRASVARSSTGNQSDEIEGSSASEGGSAAGPRTSSGPVLKPQEVRFETVSGEQPLLPPPPLAALERSASERAVEERGGAAAAFIPAYPEPPRSAPGGARGRPPTPPQKTEAAYSAARLRRDWSQRVERLSQGGSSRPTTPGEGSGGGWGLPTA